MSLNFFRNSILCDKVCQQACRKYLLRGQDWSAFWCKQKRAISTASSGMIDARLRTRLKEHSRHRLE
jgi:hypothetical protein